MGDAKRRRSLDPTYGQPIIYTLKIHPAQQQDELLEIPFRVARRVTPLATLQAAQAVAIAILGYLVTGGDDWKRDVRIALGEEATASLQEVRGDLSQSAWAGLHTPGGDCWFFETDRGAMPSDVEIPQGADWQAFHPGETIRRAS